MPPTIHGAPLFSLCAAALLLKAISLPSRADLSQGFSLGFFTLQTDALLVILLHVLTDTHENAKPLCNACMTAAAPVRSSESLWC